MCDLANTFGFAGEALSLKSGLSGVLLVATTGKQGGFSDALARDVIRPAMEKHGLQWHGWHAFRRGLATKLHRLGVADEIIQRILRHGVLAVTQNCYIKTSDAQALAAMRSLENAPNMHLNSPKRLQVN